MNYQRTFFIQGIIKPQTLHPWFDLGFIGKSPWWFGGFKFRIFGIVPLCFFFCILLKVVVFDFFAFGCLRFAFFFCGGLTFDFFAFSLVFLYFCILLKLVVFEFFACGCLVFACLFCGGLIIEFFCIFSQPAVLKKAVTSRRITLQHQAPQSGPCWIEKPRISIFKSNIFFLCLTVYWICSSINKSKWNNMVIFGWIKPNAWYLYLKFCQICKYLIILSWFKYEIHNMSILLFAIRHFMNLNIIISTIFFQSWKFGNTFGARAFETPLPCWLRMGCGWDGGFMAGLLVCPIFFPP